uniref:Putative ovule protein n=1 Tax=Solanum chacoense TaxID=4108 RepID=A0A0V0II17_SOLCH
MQQLLARLQHCLFLNYYSGGALEGFLAACDAGRGSPSGPFTLLGEKHSRTFPSSRLRRTNI